MYHHAWGTTHRFRTSHGDIFLCQGDEGYSSRHCHQHHVNAIHVRKGCLDVEVNGKWYRLEHGQSLAVLPGNWHRLVLVEPTWFTETYTRSDGSMDPRDDIVRQDTGSGEHWRP